MTTANKISIIRILLVPVFISQVLYYVEGGLEWHRIAAIATFALAAISDGIDGYLARHYNQRSELGAILDPLADKLLLVAGIVLLSFHHGAYLPRLPLWLPVTVISRDLILLTGMVVINHLCGKTRVRPHWIGKVATVLQMAAILWGLFKFDSRGLFLISLGAAVCTGGSGLIYILFGIRQLAANPASLPTGSGPESKE
jgi:CDP-diacylglycerol--glycerol-3-phosphate 3-phosphatidyltransferase